ncbi:hypothetical protein TRIUR3_11659 [Triticum urartu]|uniref:Uncharacterized protein n=1 Tax=Triticum urartu TaxID=4572 RepID=M7Z4Q8_TRIUA|nr:hypothetical protein TRIUR3_11659 [Triticum urartu]
MGDGPVCLINWTNSLLLNEMQEPPAPFEVFSKKRIADVLTAATLCSASSGAAGGAPSMQPELLCSGHRCHRSYDAVAAGAAMQRSSMPPELRCSGRGSGEAAAPGVVGAAMQRPSEL